MLCCSFGRYLNKITEFEPAFADCLPETYQLLRSAGLVVHPSVTQITLHGSRGLAQNYRPDSDIDLSLVVSTPRPLEQGENLSATLQAIVQVTLYHWKAAIKADLAAVFPLHPCALACFQFTTYHPEQCSLGGTDCFGIYKIQNGYSGIILNAGIQVERMYPCLTVWKRE